MGGILIALIPKCPFCILAYSSAISLCCSAKVVYTPEWTSWLSVILAFITLSGIILNYRGKRTWFAALLVVLGSLLIIQAELFTGELGEYYYGAAALLLGVWINGSFLYFFKKAFLSPRVLS